MAAQSPSTNIEKFKADEWIPALAAVHLLSPILGSDKAAKEAICERLRDCALETSCAWVCYGADIGDFDDVQPKQSNTKFGSGYAWIVASDKVGTSTLGWAFWSHSRDWEKDVKRWRWHLGLFVVTRPAVVISPRPDDPLELRFPSRMIASQVHFKKNQILNLGGQPTYEKRMPSPAGRKPSDAWAEWVAEIVLLEHEGGIDLTTTPDKLRETIDNKLASLGIEPPSRSRTYPVAKAIMEALRKRGRLIT